MNILTQSLKLRKLVKKAKKEKSEIESFEKVENSNVKSKSKKPKKHIGLSTSRTISNTIAYIVLIIKIGRAHV